MGRSPASAKDNVNKRQPHRREQILDAAMELFHQKGYHGTGMDEIGDAAGITGPGVYRHFESKEQILAVGIRAKVTDALERSRAIVETTESPELALDGLISNFVDGLLGSRALSAVLMRETPCSRPGDPPVGRPGGTPPRRGVVHVLSQLRADLSDGEARMMVHAALWMCLSVTYYESGIDPKREGEVLKRMVRAALLCPAPRS